MRLEVEGWREGKRVEERFTCEGENVAPEVRWGEVPPGTKSLALALVDPDAPSGLFVHWLLFNVDPAAGGIRAGASTLPEGAQEGTTNFGGLDYGGPCPPPGKPHRYRVELYALDQRLKLSDGVTYRHVRGAMGGHVLAETHITGLFGR